MGRIDMTYDEVKRRMKNGATAQVIADLNGVTVQAVNAFIKRNKEAEAGLPEPEYFMGHSDKSPKLLVDMDVYEEFTNIRHRIDMELEATCQKVDILKAKLAQVEQVIELIGIKGDKS